MSQSTLDDEDLFGEAADEIREDVETHLEAAVAELPSPEAVWEVDAANTLGALNGLRSALEIGEAREHLRDAKKWHTMGERADAFEDDSLGERIDAIESVIESVETTAASVGELTTSLPDLKGKLDDLQDDD